MPQKACLPHAILFDWDKTLVDNWGAIGNAMNEVLKAFHRPTWSQAEIDVKCRRALRETFPEWFGADWERARDIFYDSFGAHHLQTLKPMQGAAELLRVLHKVDDLYLGVVSNKKGSYLRAEAQALGWSSFFGKIVGAGDAPHDKPAPDPLDLIKPALPENPTLWYVGDNELDLHFARAIGAQPLLIGHDLPEPDGQGDYWGVRTCDEIVQWINLNPLAQPVLNKFCPK